MGALDGKVAIVTGAGRGLGRSHALTLAAEGAKVVVNDLGDEAKDVVSEIEANGGEASVHNGSVSDWKASEELVQHAIDTYGDLHVLVNNAGILRDGMSFNMSEEDWDAVIAVHLKGHFAPARHAAVYWREQAKAGNEVGRRMIHTSSEAGLFGNAGQANYAAAKAGIAALAMVFARELERYGVTSNAIAPRARTRMTEQSDFLGAPEDPEEFDAMAPENVSPTVAWLASDDAAGVSGQVFVVIGGSVYVLDGWSIAGQIKKEGRLTVDEISARRDELFGERPTGPP